MNCFERLNGWLIIIAIIDGLLNATTVIQVAFTVINALGNLMNDFTKEELIYLYDMMCSISIAGHPIDDYALYEKINSMIHNYCDHVEVFTQGSRKHCCKCGRWFREFLDWMEEAKWILPPRMTIEEARQIYERKCQEEEEIENSRRFGSATRGA